jgi:hypothetical protein
MIILRQKIFFDYSKYTPEEEAIVRAKRKETAKYLLEQRKKANDTLKKEQSIYKANFTPMSSDTPQDAAEIISRRNKLNSQALNKRNETYDRLLQYSKQRQELTDQGIDLKRNGSRAKTIADKINENKQLSGTGFIKRAWNGEVGLGKTGNRAAMIGIPIIAATGTALALRKKKKEEQEKKKNSK